MPATSVHVSMPDTGNLPAGGNELWKPTKHNTTHARTCLLFSVTELFLATESAYSSFSPKLATFTAKAAMFHRF